MTEKEKKAAAKRFVEAWRERGDEKQETQVFWLSLLNQVFGVADPTPLIQFEKRAKLDATGFIDAYLPATRVLIEQKGADIDLRKPQSTGLTPYRQARQYASVLPLSEHPRWIVTCNFREFLIYDQEKPAAEPESIPLRNLPKEYYRLAFLVEEQRELLKREEEVSIKAGEIVGKLYDALLRQYAAPDDPATLHSLNVLCVRLVFCLYAEDAGIFGVRNQFADYIRKFPVEMVRRALLDLFRILDTPVADRVPAVGLSEPARITFDYIMGNPPFVGARLMSREQKEDVLSVFGPKWKNAGNLDYVSCWYKKAADLMRGTKTRAALVSTNSVSQGESVAVLWKPLFEAGVAIDFAHRAFCWDSEAHVKAHVHCVIVGFSFGGASGADRDGARSLPADAVGRVGSPSRPHAATRTKLIFTDGKPQVAQNINGYLLDAPDIFAESRKRPLCAVPEMVFGSMPNDGGALSDYTTEARNQIVARHPQAAKMFRILHGNSRRRRCCLAKSASPIRNILLFRKFLRRKGNMRQSVS